MYVRQSADLTDWSQLDKIPSKINVDESSKKEIKREFKKSDILDKRKIIYDLFSDFLKTNKLETEEKRGKVALAAELYAEAPEQTGKNFYLFYGDNKPFMKIFSTAMVAYYMYKNDMNRGAPTSFKESMDQQVWSKRYEELKNS